MAPIEATVALSHVEGVSDSARARELYKYYQPAALINSDNFFPVGDALPISPSESAAPREEINVKSAVTSSKVSSPDTALTAFCQLTTWRTGAQRAMISLIDTDTQYFIAESTKTVDLVDVNNHGPGDDIWIGCSSVSKAGRLCERTLEVKPTSESDYPCFIVSDLSKDERFDTLPFVTDSPFLRFYAGVPLITKRGIPIGSLFVVDNRVFDDWGPEKIHFMGTMAKTVMKHMEMVREVEERRRGMKMSRGLASFVEGRAQLVEADLDAEEGEGTKIAGQFETEPEITRTKSKNSTRDSISPSQELGGNVERKEKEYSAALSKTEAGILASHEQLVDQSSRPDFESLSQPISFGGTSVSALSPQDGQDKPLSPGSEYSEVSAMKLIFSRAANLIREAFEVDGGTVFYDAQISFNSVFNRRPEINQSVIRRDSLPESPTGSSHTSGDEQLLVSDPVASSTNPEIESPATPPKHSPRSQSESPGLGDSTFPRMTDNSHKPVDILGFSTPDASSIHGDGLPGSQSFTPFGEKALFTLLRRYPRGKLWTFDSDGAVSSSSEEEIFKPLPRDPIQRGKDLRRRQVRSAKAKSDARFLSRHFPGVRQLLFVPLWDAGRSRWLSGCFTWSTEPTRILSRQNELSFLTAFGNSVMAEWQRIDTEIADQKKGDFIGSISHELRSPLHGILASAEFLEEVTSGWEKQLVETIDSCGRTLLDTINHILDFSKINHFEKNWRKSKKERNSYRHSRSGSGPLALKQSELPMLNLFQDVDISVICEEVVESVFAGHVFQNITAQSFDMVYDNRGKMSDARNRATSSDQIMGPQQLQHLGVAVILDIAPQNYHFTTQPGALRRLIMNLLGNSLKYTSHGYVMIKLEASETESLSSPPTAGSGDSIPRSMVVLTVSDTGKGISADFLRSKLFTPFAQENSLSSGTGLGLSIVRKIVSLLEGEISIDSEVGRGTQVQVMLPLLREMPKLSDSSGTPKSTISAPREDDTISTIRPLVLDKRVSLHGFDVETKDNIILEGNRRLKASVTTFVSKWYGMNVVPLSQKPHIIITNEANPTKLDKLIQQVTSTHKSSPSIIVLFSHSTRFERSPADEYSGCKVGFLAKPIGPIKLARAIKACLEGIPPITTPGFEAPVHIENSDLTSVFEELSVSPRGGELLDNTRMAADSENARKAIESPTPNAVAEKSAEFPFPHPASDLIPKSKSTPADIGSLRTIPELSSPVPSPSSSNVKPPKIEKLLSPSILLVDDNHINLRLLHHYLKTKNFAIIDEAQNGLEAVQACQMREVGYDIIFMDITMPILDGFGATREIRSLEEARRRRGLAEMLPVLEEDRNTDVHRHQTLSGSTAAPIPEVLVSNPAISSSNRIDIDPERRGRGTAASGALIIAFTGRSSIEDQTEALRVGIDLFMTKPVAFREVGKIIDNWVANREREKKETSIGFVASPSKN